VGDFTCCSNSKPRPRHHHFYKINDDTNNCLLDLSRYSILVIGFWCFVVFGSFSDRSCSNYSKID
jgi:hypothetical protein